MVHVWMVKTDRVLSEEEAAALTACLPPERRVRLAGQLPRQQAEVLWAYGLLLALLRERCGWREIPSMDRTDSGKPFFPGHPQVHFSISHTEGAAAAAVADAPVGVDIQRIQTPPRHLARLTGMEEPEPFFESWVRWEARAKRTGTGILTWSGTGRLWRRGKSVPLSLPSRAMPPLPPGRRRSCRSRCGG